MLSNEEKKAIEYLKENLLVRAENGKIVAVGNSYKLILLNLIETQSKEIEDLKFKYQARKDRTKKEIEKLKEKNKKIEEINYRVNKNLLETAEEIVKLKKDYSDMLLQENVISKDKIKAIIEDLEKEQEDNRKSLYDAVNNLCFKEIDKISDRISVNMTVREILQSLLEEE